MDRQKELDAYCEQCQEVTKHQVDVEKDAGSCLCKSCGTEQLLYHPVEPT